MFKTPIYIYDQKLLAVQLLVDALLRFSFNKQLKSCRIRRAPTMVYNIWGLLSFLHFVHHPVQ
jgi:hypothetical protein